jgi:hypothetical protein
MACTVSIKDKFLPYVQMLGTLMNRAAPGASITHCVELCLSSLACEQFILCMNL